MHKVKESVSVPIGAKEAAKQCGSFFCFQFYGLLSKFVV